MTPTVQNNLQRAAKNVVYAITNSNAMNGLSADSKLIEIMPLWKKALIALDIVVGALAAFVILLLTFRLVKQRNK